MKLLVINPNTDEAMTEAIEAIARKYARPETVVVAVRATAGPRSIEGHYDEATSLLGTVERVLAGEAEFDAFVIACFSNHPAINAARELTAKPVLGIAEAGMLVACLLGHTFSIVTTSPRWKPMLEDAVRAYGLQDRCASVRTSGLAVLDLEARPHEQVVETLLEEGRRAVAEDGAEVICLGCAGMAGCPPARSTRSGRSTRARSSTCRPSSPPPTAGRLPRPARAAAGTATRRREGTRAMPSDEPLLTPALLARLARLTELELDRADAERLAPVVESTFRFVKELDEVDVADAEPATLFQLDAGPSDG
jgi:allantoin racemase